MSFFSKSGGENHPHKIRISKDFGYIPVIFQNAIFGLLLFTLAVLKKIRNRAGYYSLFSKQPAQKSSRPKTSILKDHGYKPINFAMSRSPHEAAATVMVP